MREPYNKEPEQILKYTLRQIFQIYYAPRDQETGEVLPTAQQEVMAESELVGAQSVGGMGLEKYECWKPLRCEIEWDRAHPQAVGQCPDVPREIVKERTYTMLFEICQRGGLEGQYGVKKDDMEALRDFSDAVWRGNEEKYEAWLKEQSNVRSDSPGSGEPGPQ